MDRNAKLRFLSTTIPEVFRKGGIWNLDEAIEIDEIEELCEKAGIKFINVIPYSVGTVTPIISVVTSLVSHIDECHLSVTPPTTLQEKSNLLKDLTQEPIRILMLIFEYLKKTHKKNIIIYVTCNDHFPMEDGVMEAIYSSLLPYRNSVALVFQKNDYTNKYTKPITYRPMDKTVYISYSHHANRTKDYIEAIKTGLTKKDIDYSIDVIDLKYRDNIREYEEEIGRSSKCIVIITPEYLESPHCMYELTQIFANKNVENRIFPLVDTGKYTRNSTGLKMLRDFWMEERNKTLQNAATPSHYTSAELHMIDIFLHRLDDIWEYLHDIDSGNIEELTQNNAEKLVSEIRQDLENETPKMALATPKLNTGGLSGIDRDVPFQQTVNQNGNNPINIGVANGPITINTSGN